MSPLKLLRRNEEGAAAIEMAIALPVLLVMIYGIFQVGLVFQANAGMQHALGEGARYATLCVPTSSGCNSPSDSAVVTRMSNKLFGMNIGVRYSDRDDARVHVVHPLQGPGGHLYGDPGLPVLQWAGDLADPHQASLYRLLSWFGGFSFLKKGRNRVLDLL